MALRPPPDPAPGAPLPTGGVPASVTASQRERVVDLLSRHYAADRLTETDLQARLDRVYLATTPAELEGVLAGLPAEPQALPDSLVTRIRAVLSGQEQRVTSVVPRRLELKARFGYVELDLTQAIFQPGVTEIDVDSFCGYVEIRVPAGVNTENAGHALLGYFAIKTAEGGTSEAPTVRITGRAVLGYMECLGARRSFLRKLMPSAGASGTLPPRPPDHPPER